MAEFKQPGPSMVAASQGVRQRESPNLSHRAVQNHYYSGICDTPYRNMEDSSLARVTYQKLMALADEIHDLNIIIQESDWGKKARRKMIDKETQVPGGRLDFVKKLVRDFVFYTN